MNGIVEHMRECEECRHADLPARSLMAALDGDTPTVDVSSLSNRVLAASRPVLSRRASRLWWQRVALAAAVGSLPLPLVVAWDGYVLRSLYVLMSALLPTSVATYVVVTYGAILMLLLGATYAAIPLLTPRRDAFRLAAHGTRT